MAISVVVTTKNEERNIANCLRAFENSGCELIVVDNYSADATCKIAAELGARVITKGPERSAQRNCGVEAASGDHVMILDADMIVPRETLEEIKQKAPNFDALYVRETRVGKKWWTKARNFERSFYDATCIDSVRVIRRDLFLKVGGFDNSLIAAEDWDFDRRINDASRGLVGITDGALLHNEAELSLRRHLEKKRYYAGTFDAYFAKWGKDDPIVRKQFGLMYRFFGVFCENGKWKRALRHPIFMAAIYFERFLVGGILLLRKMRRK